MELRIELPALCAAALLLAPACGTPDGGTGDPDGSDFIPGGNQGDDDDVGDDDDAVSTSLKGIVRDIDGNPVSGVRVWTNTGLETTTDLEGKYSMDELEATGAVLLNLDHADYAITQVPFQILADVDNVLNVTMARVDITGSFQAASGHTIQIPDGAVVELPAGGFVDADGNPYDGEVRFEATSYDLMTDELFAVPGDFTAIDITGASQTLESFGMFQVNLVDAAGNEINLADGSDATVVMPVQGAAALGETIPAWSYDTERGKWVEEAVGTVVELEDGSLAWEFRAPHFSTWNCDQPIRTHGCVNGTVTNSQGTPRQGATVRAIGLTYVSTTLSRTGQDGSFCVEVKNGETVQMEISYTVGGQVASQLTDPVTIPAGQASCNGQTAGCVSVGTIPVDILTCVSGFVINQQGQPIVDQPVFSPSGGQATTDSNGAFCMAVPVFQTTEVYSAVESGGGMGWQPVRMFTQPSRPDCASSCSNIAVLRPYTNTSCAEGSVVMNQQSVANVPVDVYDGNFPAQPVFTVVTAQDGSFCAPVPSGLAEVTVQVGDGDSLCDGETISTQGLGGETCGVTGQGAECSTLGTFNCNN